MIRGTPVETHGGASLRGNGHASTGHAFPNNRTSLFGHVTLHDRSPSY